MAKRASQGDGSFRKRGDTWECAVSLGRNAAGERVRVYVYGDTKAEARRAREQLLEAHERGEDVAPNKRTVGQASDRLLDVIPLTEVREQSVTRYRYDAARLARGRAVDEVPLLRLAREHVELWQLSMKTEGESASARRRALKWLRRVLEDARERGWCAANVAAKVPLPKVAPTRAPDYFEAEQLGAILKVAHRFREGAVAVLGFDSGARISELLGGRRHKIDLRARWHIDLQALEPDRGPVRLDELKTERSNRVVKITDYTLAVLREHARMIEAEGAEGDLGLLFPTSTGTLQRASNWRKRTWYPLLEEARVKRLTPHAMRHTCATLMVDRGVSVKLGAARLGDSERVFLETYCHPTDRQRERMTAVLEELMQEAA